MDSENINGLKRQDRWNNITYTYDIIEKRNMDYIKGLEKYKIVEIEGKRICFFHGSPYNTRDSIFKDSYEMFNRIIKDFDCDIYLMGHTHINTYVNYKDKIFVNPGSVGMPISHGKKFRYGVLCIDNGNLYYENKTIEYNYEEVKKYLLSSDYHIKVKEWSELSLNNLNYNRNYTQEFVDFVEEEASKNGINTKDETPNYFWREMYEKFIKKNPEIEKIS